MPRTFTSASSEYIGFTPRTFDTWVALHIYMLGRRHNSGVYHTIYYTGSGAGDGNIQMGVNNLNDIYLGTNASAGVSFAGTIGAGTGASNFMGAAKATGASIPRADYVIGPFQGGWTHSNMSGTQANPATTASTIEEIGRYNGSSDYWNGDIEWVGIWNQSAQINGNLSEGFPKIAPRFLAGILHGCQRFWWFNQFVSDTVADRTGRGADQIARTGTTHTTTSQLLPSLFGTTFDVVPGVL